MSRRSHTRAHFVVLDTPGLGQMKVDVEAFFEFSFWLAEELQDLVASRARQPLAGSDRMVRKKPLDARP